MIVKKLIFSLIFVAQFCNIYGKESVYIINGKESLNVVSQKFLSFSIEPDDFLENLNDENQYNVYKHLKPAFLRLSGESTHSVTFSPYNNNSAVQESSIITPNVWKQIYIWFLNTALTPIFPINKEYFNDTWNSQILRPILDMIEEMGFNCYWQLGYGCDHKSFPTYLKNMHILKDTMKKYSTARLIGGNSDSCVNFDLAKKAAVELEGIVDAVILEPYSLKRNVMPTEKSLIWMNMPQTRNPLTFASALQWSKQVIDAASNGYKVLFWKTSINLLSHSPVLWISLLYKRLVGQTVLGINSNLDIPNGSGVSAHCAKQYESQGAIIVFIVNSGSNKFTASVKVASSTPKNIEVQSYIVTADINNTVYLNGKKLTKHLFETNRLIFVPKLETIKTQHSLNLITPPKSISFFVLPHAGIKLCGYNKTSNFDFISKLTEEPSLTSRIGAIDTPKESRLDAFKKKLQETKVFKREPKQEILEDPETLEDFNKFIAHKPKMQKLRNDKSTKLEIIFTEKPLKDKANSNYPRQIALELTKDEIKQILLERAKFRVLQNNIPISNKQLEKKMKKASVQAQKYKRFATVSPLKRKLGYKKKKNKLRFRKYTKRDVSSLLLKKKQDRENKKSGDLFADLAPSKFLGRYEEEKLKPGERYVDERLKFLDPGDLDTETDEEEDAGYVEYEDFRSLGPDNDKLEFMEELNNRDRERTRLMQHGRVKRNDNLESTKKGIKDKIEHIIVKKRHNFEHPFVMKLKNFKEKIENRLKMDSWIRNKQKQNLMESRRKRMSHNGTTKYTHYTPKIVNNIWTTNDLRGVRKMPSYSREELDEELLPITKKQNTLRRKREITYADVNENVIEVEDLNKIPKLKYTFEISTVRSPLTTQEQNYSIYTTESADVEIPTNYTFKQEKTFLKDVFGYVTEFFQNMYGKISDYFSS